MNRTLPLELLPLKKAVREAVTLLGGIDGVAPLVDRTRSTVGRWVNINDCDMPPMDAAFAIDQALVFTGRPPMVARCLARLLGATLVSGTTESATAINLLSAHGNIVREGGDVQVAIAEALADGTIDPAERNKIRNEIADNIDALHALDNLLQTGAD